MLDGLQKVGMRYRGRRQQWAANVLLGTNGIALTQLKGYKDAGQGYHTTYKLVFSDLQGPLQAQVPPPPALHLLQPL